MEGVAGVARDDQTDPGSPFHSESRHLLTQEVNAAVLGALDAGAREVVVSDGHWNWVRLFWSDARSPAAASLLTP